jgi:tripartite-type tricarboxylate transporter receptor subunit TctC
VSEVFPGFDVQIYLGLMVPKGTPDSVVAALNAELNKILSSPEMRDPLEKLGVAPAGGEPSDFQARIEADYEARGKLICDFNIRAD